jgi:hypothetical protein
MNTLGDIMLVAIVAIPCALIVLGMRGLYLEARRALLGRDK